MFKATILLAEAVRVAADAATSDTAQTFVVLISALIALRALLASIYPADEVDDRYVQAMALNDIASPAWLEPGDRAPAAAARCSREERLMPSFQSSAACPRRRQRRWTEPARTASRSRSVACRSTAGSTTRSCVWM